MFSHIVFFFFNKVSADFSTLNGHFKPFQRVFRHAQHDLHALRSLRRYLYDKGWERVAKGVDKVARGGVGGCFFFAVMLACK